MASKNLLHDIHTVDEIREILDRHPRRPLLPPLDTDSWQNAAAHPLLQPTIHAIRARAESEARQPLPLLSAELCPIYHQTGSRWEFETVYFERRRQLARAAIALLLSDKTDPARPQFRDSLLTKLTDILDEPSWAFPAHVKDPSGSDPFQIDLFCAETANLMAEMLDLFSELIPAELRARILTRLREKIWLNYLEKDARARFWWITGTNNWNAVCHQGVIGSALAVLDDNALLATLLFEAKKSLPLFLSGFGPDGGSSEGPGYWDYGFGWFAVLNEQLEARTGGELSIVADDPHVLEIARFGPRGSLSGGQLICFSDSPPVGILRPANLFYLGERLNDSLCRDQALANYALVLQRGVDLDFQRTDLFYLARFLLRCPEKLPAPSSVAPAKDVYLPDLAVVVASTTDPEGHLWEFAAKAGHNEEHHNHNDCGSYILNLDGIPFITEIGQPRYDRDFFQAVTRYQNLAARSLGHSVPLINGCEQAVGAQYVSTVLDYSSTPDETKFVMELAGCYPPEAACRSLIRTFRFEKTTGRLSVRDDFDLIEVRSTETAVTTNHPVVPGKDSVAIIDDKLRLVFNPGTILGGVEKHTYFHRDPKIVDLQTLQRIVLKPATLSSKFSLGFVAQLS